MKSHQRLCNVVKIPIHWGFREMWQWTRGSLRLGGHCSVPHNKNPSTTNGHSFIAVVWYSANAEYVLHCVCQNSCLQKTRAFKRKNIHLEHKVLYSEQEEAVRVSNMSFFRSQAPSTRHSETTRCRENFCCEPWADLVEFGVVLVGFSHVVEGWHGPAGYGILYCYESLRRVSLAAEWPCCHDPLRFDPGHGMPFWTHAMGGPRAPKPKYCSPTKQCSTPKITLRWRILGEIRREHKERYFWRECIEDTTALEGCFGRALQAMTVRGASNALQKATDQWEKRCDEG